MAETLSWGEEDALYLRPQIRGKGGKESRKEVTCLWTGYIIIHSLFHPARAFSIDKEGSWACGKECQDLSGRGVSEFSQALLDQAVLVETIEYK